MLQQFRATFVTLWCCESQLVALWCWTEWKQATPSRVFLKTPSVEEEEDQIETRLPYIGKMCSSKFLLPSHSLPLSLIQRLGRNTFVSNTSQALLHITVMWMLACYDIQRNGIGEIECYRASHCVDCRHESGEERCKCRANKCCFDRAIRGGGGAVVGEWDKVSHRLPILPISAVHSPHLYSVSANAQSPHL